MASTGPVRLRRAAGLSGKGRPGRGERVEGVGLALGAAGSPVWAVDLDHSDALGGEVAGQSRAVGAGALHSNLDHLPESTSHDTRVRTRDRVGRHGLDLVGQRWLPADLRDHSRGRRWSNGSPRPAGDYRKCLLIGCLVPSVLVEEAALVTEQLKR